MRRLPPLTAVEAFVQVARLGSVKMAADELALSSPALSRRVQAMERFVGRPLFARRHQAMTLNADGERLLERIAPALDALADAIDETGGADQMRLRLGVLPLYASAQLMPRLPALRERHPTLQIDIDTGSNAIGRLGEGLDAAIVTARSIEPPLYGRQLTTDTIAVIAGGALATGPRAIRAPADIAGTTVLVHRDMPDNFEVWRAGMGLPDLEPVSVTTYDSGALILEAAAQGLGVAFMLDVNFDTAADPRLVQLFAGADDRQVESTFSYWFVCRRAALSRRAVRLFHDWLVETAG